MITLPGSWIAIGLRHGDSAADSARSRPAARAASTSNTPPAWETTDVPSVSAWTHGYSPIFFTLKVLLA